MAGFVQMMLLNPTLTRKVFQAHKAHCSNLEIIFESKCFPSVGQSKLLLLTL